MINNEQAATGVNMLITSIFEH